jgi:adenylate cyclase
LADPGGPADAAEPVSPARLASLLETVEHHLLGEPPSLTRIQVAERAGVPLEMAVELWRLLGFATNDDHEVAFTEADVDALRASHDLRKLGILGEDSQAALVRTWGRSFARLAEWETTLLANVAGADDDPEARLSDLAVEVLPRVEALQTYIWRRHLASASSRLVSVQSGGTAAADLAVCFVDIVGYTSRSKSLDERELVAWLEGFEDTATGIVVDHGGRIIKTIGDEILFVADDPVAAAEIALLLTARGEDADDPFPSVRAALAYGEVVSRLGDVFGPVVNIASRLTSLARPGSVLVDRHAYEVLSGQVGGDEDDDAAVTGAADAAPWEDDASPYRFRRMRRSSVKGYAKLQSWVLRRA